jgi:hypothetical protein
MDQIEKAFSEAGRLGFWGQIQVDYQNGMPVVIRKIETTKIHNNEDNNRWTNTEQTPRSTIG